MLKYFKGYLEKESLSKIEKNFDILLHVESFDNIHVERIKSSFSTKLSDFLVSGKQVLIVGPKNVHSIEYFERYDLGYTFSNKTFDGLEKILEEIFLDTDFHKIKNAVNKAKNNHMSTFSDFI